MSNHIYFRHQNGIRDYEIETGKVTELCEPMPKVPVEAFEYQKRLLDVCDILTGVSALSISESMAKTRLEDDELKAQWALGDYMSTAARTAVVCASALVRTASTAARSATGAPKIRCTPQTSRSEL